MLAASCVLSRVNPVAARTPETRDSDDKPIITVQADAKVTSEGSVALNIHVRNVGLVPLYVVTDTERADRSKGPYFDTDSLDGSLLICSFQLYPPNPFNPPFDGTSVHLKRLEPSESDDEFITISWPLQTTEPPFRSMPGTEVVPAGAIKRIEVRMGMLPASPSLVELVKRKRAPHDAFTGREQVQSGAARKSLYEIQETAHSKPIEVRVEPGLRSKLVVMGKRGGDTTK